jgi:Adenylate and Guanylate cyclase catalytic domain
MPRGAPEDRSGIPRSMSSPATSSSNTVVSRSSIPRTRKPPRRGTSGGPPLGEMKAATFRERPNTPMSNRQRLATRAAMEMSLSINMDGLESLTGSEVDDGEESLNSNVSAGSEALKAPSPEPRRLDGSRDTVEGRRQRSSSQKASARHRDRRNGRRLVDDSEERPQRPRSSSSLDESETPRAASNLSLSSTGSRSSTTSNSNSNNKSDDLSNRSERRMDRRSTNRQRSSSQKRGDRDRRKRSSSLHEKRNGRGQRMSTSKFAAASNGRPGPVPKSSGSLHRAHVTEKEIMELLSLDYEMPLTEASNETMDRKMNTSSSSLTEGGISRSQRRSRSDNIGKPPTRSTKSHGKLGDRSPSLDRGETTHSMRSSRTGSSSISRDRDTRAIRGDIAQSTHSTPPAQAAFLSPSSNRPRRRPPQRSKSADSDHGLDNFLQQNMSVSRRKKTSSGSRSVASMPASAKGRRRRVSISERTDDTEDTTKPNSIPDMDEDYEEDLVGDHSAKKGSSYRSGGGSSAVGDNTENDDDDDAASIDLDLATARTFQQQTFNEKLQLHLSKTDSLLYSVFPKHVADALRNGQKVAPENHELVTIFFSDIVGFTDISSKLDPLKISDMLDRLYHSLDALSDYHDVFKVET